MSVDHLLKLAALARPLIAGAAVRRVLPRVIVLVILTLAAGLLLAGLLFGGLYALAFHLSQLGWEAPDVLCATLGAATGLLLLLGGFICYTLHSLRRNAIPHLPTAAGDMFDAFMDGLNTPPKV